MNTINIGITSVGSGVGQSVVDSCRLSNLPLKLFGYGSNPFAFGSYACDVQRSLPSIYAENYLDELLNVCVRDHIHILIPGLDDELLLIADNIDKFNRLGISAPVSTRALIELCRDKEQMSVILNKYGDFFVKSYKKAQLQNLAADKNIEYPLIAKPLSGFASRGLRIILNENDIEQIPDDYVIQEIAIPSSKDTNHAAFMRALEKGEVAQLGELSLQIVIGKYGQELGRYASYNKLHNGVPIEIIPTDVPDVWSAVDKLIPLFLEYGLYGPLNIQGRMTDAGPKFFEMNARFTGITGLRALTGFNEVAAIIADASHVRFNEPKIQQNFRKIGLRQVANKVVDFDHNFELAKSIKAIVGIEAIRTERKVLVTGANSYLGRAVVDDLYNSDSKGEIFALVRSPERFNGKVEPKMHPGVTLVAVEDLYSGKFNLGLIDVICHIASARPVNTNYDIAESLRFTQFLIAQATAHQIPGFINISSQSVYGTSQEPLWDESTPVAPETPYAQSKWASELLVSNIKYANPHVSITSLRLGQVIGPSCVMRFNELPHKYILAALRGEKLLVHGGGQKLDFIDVRDAAAFIARICRESYKNWESLLNISAGFPVSVLELAELCIETAEKLGATSASIEVNQDFKAPSFGMSIDKLQSVYGWKPHYDIRSTLSSVAEKVQYEIQK